MYQASNVSQINQILGLHVRHFMSHQNLDALKKQISTIPFWNYSKMEL